MNHARRFAFLVALALATQVRSATALDDTNKEAVRSLSNEAATDYDKGRYETARDKFSRAYEIARVPKLAVWAARANARLGKLVAAYELYRQALALEANDLWNGTIQQQAQQDAQDELQKLQPRIPKLTILVEGCKTTEVTINVDSISVPNALVGVQRYTDPGKHAVVGKRGEEVVTETTDLKEGDQKQVLLKFREVNSVTPVAGAEAPAVKPEPARTASISPVSQPSPVRDQTTTSPSRQRTWGWVAIGIGGAGVALGAVTGVMLISKHGDLIEKCPNNDCRGNWPNDVDDFNRTRTISMIGFAIGGVAAATGVTLLLTAPKRHPMANMGLWMSPNSAGITGRF